MSSSAVGDAEKFLMRRKEALQAALARLLVKKKVKSVEELIALYDIPGVYVCVWLHIIIFTFILLSLLFSCRATRVKLMEINYVDLQFCIL